MSSKERYVERSIAGSSRRRWSAPSRFSTTMETRGPLARGDPGASARRRAAIACSCATVADPAAPRGFVLSAFGRMPVAVNILLPMRMPASPARTTRRRRMRSYEAAFRCSCLNSARTPASSLRRRSVSSSARRRSAAAWLRSRATSTSSAPIRLVNSSARSLASARFARVEACRASSFLRSASAAALVWAAAPAMALDRNLGNCARTSRVACFREDRAAASASPTSAATRSQWTCELRDLFEHE